MTDAPIPKGQLNLPAYSKNEYLTVTELVLEDGTRVQIDPCQLFGEALANADKAIVKYLIDVIKDLGTTLTDEGNKICQVVADSLEQEV